MRILHKILLGWSDQGGRDGREMQHACGKWETHTTFWLENLEEKSHFGDIDLRVWRCGLDSTGSEQGSVAVSCKHGNKLSSSIERGEFLD